MTTELYIKCFIACVIGNLIHICFKIYGLSKDYRKANMKFSLGNYFKDDGFALLFDFAASAGLVYAADEWLHDPIILGKIKTAFIIVGFTGSYVILFFASKAKRRFRETVDEKTNKADGIES